MTNVAVGVTRCVIHPGDGLDEPSEFVSEGSLWIDPPDGTLIEGDIVLYTLDEVRLRGMLAAARAGEDVDAIMLALDAAALDTPDDDDEEDGDAG